MNNPIEVTGFNVDGKPAKASAADPVLTVIVHKSATKRQLLDGSAILNNWLADNKLRAEPRLAANFEICGFDNEDAPLWKDNGARTFCRLVLDAFLPTVAGLAFNITPHSRFSLIPLAATAIGESCGVPIEVVARKDVSPSELQPIWNRCLSIIQKTAPEVAKRSRMLRAGDSPVAISQITAAIVDASWAKVPVFPTVGFAANLLKIANSIAPDLIACANRTGEGMVVPFFPGMGYAEDE